MGLGDQIIASGIAKDAWTKGGKKIAFGDGLRVIWDKHSREVFLDNPNIAFPGNESHQKVKWVSFYKGNRGYNKQGPGHWIWNFDWKCKPGQLFLSHSELEIGDRYKDGFIVIEPNVPWWKPSSVNKDWGYSRYQEVADRLKDAGHKVIQFVPPTGGNMLGGVQAVKANSFRDAASILRNAAAYVGAEGGLHHAAAALNVKGVVIFGGWIPPSVTGYDLHKNLVGSNRFCGNFNKCDHCKEAMQTISIDTVYNAVKGVLKNG